MGLDGLGRASETREGGRQAWTFSKNPIGGWYESRRDCVDAGMYIPPLMEKLGLVELEHNTKNNQ
jgi:hypothetical protein